MATVEEITKAIQRRVGVKDDGKWGKNSATAVARALDLIAAEKAAEDVRLAMMIRHLRREEGVMPYAYQDHLGFWTIGVGRLIDKGKGGRLTDAEIDALLTNDIARFRRSLENDPRFRPAWDAVKFNDARATALLSMMFQMGEDGLATFKNTLAAIAAKNFTDASTRMLDSLWAKQTPERAARVAKMMRTGVEA